MTYRVKNIVVAVGLALVAVLLTTFYVTNYKRHVQKNESTVTVYVAKRDIPQGTLGSQLVKHGWMAPEAVVQRTVVPGAIRNPDQVQSLLTTDTIYAGEQVSLRRFANNAEQGVRAQLHGTLRAISIPGTPDQLLSGTLRDGDHVDLIANLKTGDCSTCFADRVIARNILVLHAPSQAKLPTGSQSSQSVLLAVSDNREEQKVFYAVENSAGWSLELRPVANAVDTPEDVEGVTSMVRDGISAANFNHFTGVGK